MENTMIDIQKTDELQGRSPKEGLYETGDSSLSERGGYGGHVAESSLYTKASLHPLAAGAAIAIGVGAAIAVTNHLRSRDQDAMSAVGLNSSESAQMSISSESESATATAGGS
jgi:hypothetical protein